MLGMDEGASFTEMPFRLAADEFLFLTTDGMIESPCRGGGQFGTRGIEDFFSRYKGTAPLQDLLEACRGCSSFDPMSDDVSALLLGPS